MIAVVPIVPVHASIKIAVLQPVISFCPVRTVSAGGSVTFSTCPPTRDTLVFTPLLSDAVILNVATLASFWREKIPFCPHHRLIKAGDGFALSGAAYSRVNGAADPEDVASLNRLSSQ